MFFFNLSTIFWIFIKIIPKKLCYYKKMFFMVEIINNFQKILCIKIIAISLYKSKKFDFINTLIKIVFIIFNNFHANHLFCMNIIALYSFWKSGRSQIFNNLITTSDYRIHYNWKFFSFFKTCFLSVKYNSQIITVINCFIKFSRIKFIIRLRKFYPIR